MARTLVRAEAWAIPEGRPKRILFAENPLADKAEPEKTSLPRKRVRRVHPPWLVLALAAQEKTPVFVSLARKERADPTVILEWVPRISASSRPRDIRVPTEHQVAKARRDKAAEEAVARRAKAVAMVPAEEAVELAVVQGMAARVEVLVGQALES